MKTKGCETFRDGMMEVLYGEASADERRRWERHATDCGACRAELSDLQDVRAGIESARPAEPAAGPAPVLVLRPSVPLFHRAALLAAAGALVAVAAVGLFRLERVAGPGADPRSSAANVEALIGAVQELARRGEGERAELVGALREELGRRDEAWRAAERHALAGILEEFDRRRQQDLSYVMSQLGSLERRTGQEVARTNQMLQMAMLERGARRER